jgi:hypothetical protein
VFRGTAGRTSAAAQRFRRFLESRNPRPAKVSWTTACGHSFAPLVRSYRQLPARVIQLSGFLDHPASSRWLQLRASLATEHVPLYRASRGKRTIVPARPRSLRGLSGQSGTFRGIASALRKHVSSGGGSSLPSRIAENGWRKGPRTPRQSDELRDWSERRVGRSLSGKGWSRGPIGLWTCMSIDDSGDTSSPVGPAGGNPHTGGFMPVPPESTGAVLAS